jgi:hypothetical protein
MPIDFPSSPTTGQVYTYEGKSWVYNGTGWDSPRALSEIGAVQTFANAAARTAAIPTPTEGIVSYLNDVNLLQTNNGSAWVTTGNAGVNAYNFVQTLYYTSSGTFTKATYPWLRAIRVKVQGAGGGGAGCASTSHAGGAGGGGAYGEVFNSDINGLSSSITVTVGAGGAGGVGNSAGTAGGTSSFGIYTANGGGGGLSAPGTGQGGTGSGITANLGIAFSGSAGGPGSNSFGTILAINGPQGGSSQLGGGGQGAGSGTGNINNGQPGLSYGGGGGGAYAQNTSNSTGGAGAPGIVIVELYA